MAEQPHEIVWKLSTAGSERGASIWSPTSALPTASAIARYWSLTWPIPVQSRPMLWTASCDCSQRMVCSKNKTAATATRSRPGCSAPTIPALCGRSPR
jgi:hypothetical protein